MGPLIGAFLFRYTNNELPFILFGAIGLVVAIQLSNRLRNIPEAKASLERPSRLRVLDKKVWPFIFVSSLASVAQAIIFQTMGFIYDKLAIVHKKLQFTSAYVLGYGRFLWL